MTEPADAAPGSTPEAGAPARDGDHTGGEGPTPPSRGDASPEPAESTPATPAKTVYLCDICGEPMLDLHCKLICEHCGFKRDCSDP